MPPEFVVDAFKVLKGEGARGNTRRVATNMTTFNGRRVLNRDRGCWQISHLYHPEVSDAQAFDSVFSAKKALEIYKGRGNWSAWCSANKMGLGKSC